MPASSSGVQGASADSACTKSLSKQQRASCSIARRSRLAVCACATISATSSLRLSNASSSGCGAASGWNVSGVSVGYSGSRIGGRLRTGGIGSFVGSVLHEKFKTSATKVGVPCCRRISRSSRNVNTWRLCRCTKERARATEVRTFSERLALTSFVPVKNRIHSTSVHLSYRSSASATV